MKKLIVFAALAAIVCGCGEVGTGERGIKKSWGEVVSREPLREGLYFYNPVGGELVTYDIKNQVVMKKMEQYSKDIQQATVSVSVTYSLDEDHVIEMELKNGKNYYQKLIEPQIEGAVKDVFGRWEAQEIIPNREKARHEIHEFIVKKLTQYGIKVSIVEIKDIEFKKAFEDAVEAKQVAAQEAIKEKNNTARLKEVAEQQVVKAQAEARSKIEIAKADAEAIAIKAHSEAQAIELRNRALANSKALIMYEGMSRWNGILPTHVLGSGALPFLDIDGLQSGKAAAK